MLNIVLPKTMYAMDQATVENQSITSLALMNRAGEAIFDKMLQDPLFKYATNRLIIAGVGNNGGDALVIAKAVLERGMQCQVSMFGNQNALSDEAKTVLNELPMSVLWNKLPNNIETCDVIVDGLFGIGLSRSLSSDFIELINHMNRLNIPIYSLDIPSGLDAETGLAMPVALKASKTYIVQLYKTGNLLNQAKDYHGEEIIVDVGIEYGYLKPEASLLNPADFYRSIPIRKHYSHKYDYGNLLIYAYQTPMLGAALLAAKAALRGGTGLVKVLIDADLKTLIEPYDIVTEPIDNNAAIESLSSRYSAIVFGPGVGKEEKHTRNLEKLLKLRVPMIVDADGLFHLKKILSTVDRKQPIILTPHQGEFERFCELDKGSMYKDLFMHLKKYDDYNFVWLLKGPTTILYAKEKCLFSNHGHPALATAGTGDVLSGIISAFLAKHYDPYLATTYGLMFHSLAAQEQVSIYGEESMIASDLIEVFPKLFRLFKANE